MHAFVSQAQFKAAAVHIARLAGRFLPPWFVLLLSLFVTLVVWQVMADRNVERAQLHFAFAVEQVEQAIQERVSLHESALRGARGHLADDAFISEAEWQRYLQGLNIQHYAGLETVGLAMRVPAADKALYIKAMRALGRDDYQINPPGERPLYFPVTYLEPVLKEYEPFIGFDMWTDPARRAAMQRATRDGTLAVTERIALVTNAVEPVYGFSMFLPVYAGGGVPPTVDQREARLVAFVFSPYTMSQFMDGVFAAGDIDLLTLRVFEGARRDAGALLYDSATHFNPSPLGQPPRFERFDAIAVGGAKWTLQFATSALFDEAHRHDDEALVWLIGVPLSLILFFMTRAMSRSRIRAIDVAQTNASRLRVSEEQFRAVAQSASDAIVSCDAQGTIVYFNPAAERMYGYPANEVIGQSIMLLAPEKDRAAYMERYRQFVQSDAMDSVGLYESIAQKKNGEAMPVELTASKWRTDEGVFMTTIVRDITARRQTEETIRRMNEGLEHRVAERTEELQHTLEEYERADQFRKSVMENAVVGLLTLDQHGLMTMANKVFCALVGYAPEELYNRHWSMLTGVEETQRLMPAVKRIVYEERTIENYEIELIRKDGQTVSVAFGANPLSVRGEVIGSVVAVMDVTERKRSDAQMQRFNAELERRVIERTAELRAANEEMESFTYSVSHDLRAPLRHIDGHIQMLLEESQETLDPEKKRRLQRIGNAALHMARLIDDLLLFSRMGKSVLRKTSVDMAALVVRAQTIVSNEAHAPKVEWDIGSLPTVRCDEHLMERLWTNLLSNALKYSSSRAVARIAVEARRSENEWVFSVRDNGVGFDMRYADKLFRVFERLHAGEFTGTGIGLASVQRIAKRHGGRAWAEGKVNEGAIFYFNLPD
ncbi:MAG TPA: PAS domain S-box protein [Burkholderiales bacterium]